MARPPLTLGSHGSVTTSHSGSKWIARCRFRDLDGVTRIVARWGSSRTAAQKALQDALRERRGGSETQPLGPTSKFHEAVDVWSAKIAERREDSTADTYRHWVDNVVLPRLGELRLHECNVPRLDAFFSQLARETVETEDPDGTTAEKIRFAANTRRTIRSIVTGVMQQAVLHGEPPGRWYGAGAERLGLTGLVRSQDMIALYERFLDPRDAGFADPSQWDEVSTLGHTGRDYMSEEEMGLDPVQALFDRLAAALGPAGEDHRLMREVVTLERFGNPTRRHPPTHAPTRARRG